MKITKNLNRRKFLQLGLVTGTGLLVGCSAGLSTLSHTGSKTGQDAELNAWLHISQQGEITFVVPATEMGQGVQTSLSMIVADELDADWDSMHTVFAPNDSAFSNPKYNMQFTGGSGSISGFWSKLRELGAAARTMLTEAAAEQWGVPVSECSTAKSVVSHPSGKRLTYGELAEAAALRKTPGSPKLKDPKEFNLIGKSVSRLDTPLKVNGSAGYGIDVKLPGMLYATLIQAPVFGGSVKAYNEQAALASPGVKKVVAVPNGMAVVADTYWHAKKGLDALAVEFNDGDTDTRSDEDFEREMKSSLATMKKHSFDDAAHTLDVEYQVPYVAHQPLEPMNCTAQVTATSCELWVPTQSPHSCALVASRITGLSKDQIKINTTYVGGGFGRRLYADYAELAVIIAKEVDAPVKMLWSREQDMQHDFYRPTTRVRFQVGLGENGLPTQWHTKLAGASLLDHEIENFSPQFSWLPITEVIGDPLMNGGLDRNLFEPNPFPYEVGKLKKVDGNIMDFGIPVGSLRSVQHSYSGFYKESVIDEVAHTVKKDPLAYRRQLLSKEPRYLGVLDLVMKKASWGNVPEGHFQGVAVHRAFETYVAEVIELSVDQDKKIKIHRITCAVDCGIVVNPDIVKKQISGGALWGLDMALFGEINIKNGRVLQSNFHDYPVLRMRDTPPVDVHIVNSQEAPTGVGEPGTPPLPAALGNAIFAATGDRIRSLPLSKHGYRV